MKKIAVGSLNPVKINAVRQIVEKVWPDAEVEGVAVPSGVSAMPMSDHETLTGARNRASAAREALNADMGIGLEGGVEPTADGLFLMGWVAVENSLGRRGIGGCARLPLPTHIARRVLAGEELGTVMDDVLDDHNIKQKGGAVGALTNGLVLREDTFALAVGFALAPFVSADLY